MILYFLVLALHKVRVPAIIFVSSECFSCCTLLISLWFAPSAVHKSFAWILLGSNFFEVLLQVLLFKFSIKYMESSAVCIYLEDACGCLGKKKVWNVICEWHQCFYFSQSIYCAEQGNMPREVPVCLVQTPLGKSYDSITDHMVCAWRAEKANEVGAASGKE